MEETSPEPREDVLEARLIRTLLRGKWGLGSRDARGVIRTSRGFGRWVLYLSLRARRRRNRSREESPKEEREPEHLDPYAAGGEGPGAQPHCAHPLGGDPGFRPPRDKPLSESSASASREPPLSKYEQEGLTGSQSRRVCGAPEIRKGAGTSGRSLPELPDPACTSGAPSWRPQLPVCCSVFLRGADRLPCGTSPARSCHAFCSSVPHPFAKAPSPPSPSEPRTVCAETPSLTWATS